ncbi:hypothetical protein FQN57_003642 [Myotisia sp. PD_48]|nr:hypothetical protein FQN57_003642 [Myotisia sp. PD_48]
MNDPVRASPNESLRVYDRGYRLWKTLYSHAVQEPGLPESCFKVWDTFIHVPPLCRDLDLKCSFNKLWAKGTSTWETSHGPCPMPSFEQEFEISISRIKPTSLVLSSDSSVYQNWFDEEDNHVSVLILAWSYIFSSYWADIISDSTIEYTESEALRGSGECGTPDSGSIQIELGTADSDAVRWWSAILAPGEGWKAYSTREQVEYRSPWSVSMDSPPSFTVSYNQPLHENSSSAISSAMALRFLSDYCKLHNVTDQSIAALSAVIYLPERNGKPVQLPIPSIKLGKNLGGANP